MKNAVLCVCCYNMSLSFLAQFAYSVHLSYRWLVWLSGNGICHINEVKLHRVRLVLRLVTTFGRSTIPVFIQATQAHSAWPSLRGYMHRVSEMVSAISGKKWHLWSYDLLPLYKSVYKIRVYKNNMLQATCWGRSRTGTWRWRAVTGRVWLVRRCFGDVARVTALVRSGNRWPTTPMPIIPPNKSVRSSGRLSEVRLYLFI